MEKLELDGHTLGQKHRHYNRLVQEAIIKNTTVKIEDFHCENSDVINLLNIDIASHNKNVDYILKVLTCDDMLYVSRAVKQSDWLINDQKYAHIVNPDYFQTNLLPKMCTKAIIKLIKHIRSNLKDPKRAELFYRSEKIPEEAVKWLPCCSLEFILENITDGVQYIKTTLLKQLCEKSITVLEIYIKNVARYKKSQALQATMFLLPSNTDRFLNLVEASDFPNFNKKATTVLMKNSAARVISNFDKYYNFIHLPKFIKYLKQINIKKFLLKQAQNINENRLYQTFNLQRLLLFIRLMPQEVRFQFVNDVFINKTHNSKEICCLSETEKNAMSMLCNIASYRTYNNHIWYQFAPFDIALQKIQELIGSMSDNKDKVSLLEIVLISAQNNISYERTFLEYLRDIEKNTEKQVMEKILKKLILNNNFIKYDLKTWNVLNDIFKRIDVYNESKKSEHVIVEAILLYNVLQKEKVSDIIENKFKFNSLVSYHKKISDDEKILVFIYLYDMVLEKVGKCKVTNEKTFKEKVDMLELTLKLLKDYQKELESYPNIINIIKDLVKVKNDQSWTTSMEALFDIKKTWRKLLFEESFSIRQTESVLFNALKHGPLLLEQNEKIVKNMLCNDKIPLIRVLGKIKIYWSASIARNMIITYKEKLNGLEDHIATTRGLSILLPFRHLQELIEKYTPKEPKVDWTKIDEIELNLQRQFAKNMHISRPQPSPETILRFAKGDYLQYALPSLLSIFYNLNSIASQEYIPNLLDAPVSLQKHGIRLAVSKLKYEQLLCSFSNIWNSNKNASIRSVMFKNIYELLCKEKDSDIIKTIWELMEIFIDNITLHEDKAIYNLLFEVEKIPRKIRGLFYMKSYNFLRRLLNSSDEFKEYETQFYGTFTAYSRGIIEKLEPEFIIRIISEYIAEEFTKEETEIWSRGCVITIISSYLLYAADEQTQLERYEKVLLPILKQSFTLLGTADFIRNNLTKLLNALRCDIKEYVIDMKKVNPYKMFLLIEEELKCALDTPAWYSYTLLTKWKLTVTFVYILNENSPILYWGETYIKVSNQFGNKCMDYLKEDCNKYFPRIYLLFVKALKSMLTDFIPENMYWDICRSLISDKNFIQGYLAAIVLVSNTSLIRYNQKEDKMKRTLQELCKQIYEHPSTEIKLHYYNLIKEIK